MAAPTFVSAVATVFDTATTPKTLNSIAVQAGDLIVVSGGGENGNSTLSTPTSTGLTFTLRGSQTTGGGQRCIVYVWTAPITTTGTISVSLARGATSIRFGFTVTVWRAHGGVGPNVVSATSSTSATAPSAALTTTAANSGIDAVIADWTAATGTRTYRTPSGSSAGVEDANFADGSTWGYHDWHHVDAGAAGSKTIGMTAPAAQRWVMVGIEVLGAASTPGTMTTTVGDAPAEGGTVTFTGAGTMTTTVGDAPADGGALTLAAAATMTTLAGDAPANGGTLTLTGAGTMTTTAGDAPGSGGTLTLVGGSGSTLVTLTGDAPADGGSLTMTGAAVMTTVMGDAPASGGTATLTGAGTMTTLAGDAPAAGGTLTLSAGANATLTTLTGDAPASGGTLTLSGAAVMSLLARDAPTGGGTATLTGAGTMTTSAGDALAEGADLFLVAGELVLLPDLIPLTGSTPPALAGISSPVALAGTTDHITLEGT